MKALKYFISAIILVVAVWNCTDEEFGSTDFIESATAPTNLTAVFDITQDNTGLVTITPNGEGANFYNVYFGDDTVEPVNIEQGESIEHTYKEGNYQVKLIGLGITGLSTEQDVPLVVSFKAPENLEVVIQNDASVSKQVNVTATADYATSFDVYYGEEGKDEPVTANIGETASYIYEEDGTYTIRVVAKSAAIETIEYSEEFVVTEILQPLTAAPKPSRLEADVISMYSDEYIQTTVDMFVTDWSQVELQEEIAIEENQTLVYRELNFAGIITETEPIDASAMEYFHFDIWSTNVTTFKTKFVDFNGTGWNDGSDNIEAEVENTITEEGKWISFDIPLTDFEGVPFSDINQMVISALPVGTVFIDNMYFWKAPSAPSKLEGTWKMAPEAGSLKVGPSPGSDEWWAIDDAGVSERACYYDDTYVFGSDGSFVNNLGSESWIEPWQGGTDSCGTPVAPHDGSGNASFSHDEAAGTVTLNGTGAYLGLAKVNNAGELPGVEVPNSIKYNITLTDDDNTLIVSIEAGGGVFWSYKLVRDGVVAPSPIDGTWVMAPEAGSMKVGPSAGSDEWWAIDDAGVADRACYYDDTFVFAGGSFNNVVGADTWIEVWQGGADACGAPVNPHDGSASATYSFSGTTVTLNGTGAYLGIPKANNDGELPNVAVPTSIIYDITLTDNNNTMIASIEAGAGVFWTFKLVKEGGTTPPPSSGNQIDLPVDFESTTVDYTLTDFGENSSSVVVDPTDANNTVAEVIKTATAATWAGTTIGTDAGFATNIPITLTNSKMTVRVWSPDAGTPIRLKIEDANDATHTCETEVNTTVAGGWETLEFDFTNEAPGTESLSVGLSNGWVYNKASLFFNFGTDGATAGEKTYYFDDVLFIQ